MMEAPQNFHSEKVLLPGSHQKFYAEMVCVCVLLNDTKFMGTEKFYAHFRNEETEAQRGNLGKITYN